MDAHVTITQFQLLTVNGQPCIVNTPATSSSLQLPSLNQITRIILFHLPVLQEWHRNLPREHKYLKWYFCNILLESSTGLISED